MADTTTHVTTPSELCAQASFDVGFEGEDNGTHTIVLDNDIDFNNEDYYYHKDNFMDFEIGSSYAAKTKIIEMNNKTISNLFIYTGYSFIYYRLDSSHQPNDWTNYENIEFKNGTFEVVLNGGSFIDYPSANTGYTGTASTTTRLEFRNCTFNIKAISFTHMFNIPPMFRYVNFINCTFNIDAYNGATNYHSIINNSFATSLSGTINRILAIESCQFKIKLNNVLFTKGNISGSKSAIIIDSIISNRNYNKSINNCIFFISYNPNIVESMTNQCVWIISTQSIGTSTTSSIGSLNNNFISVLDSQNYVVKVDSFISSANMPVKGSFFYNSDRITLDSSTAYNKYGLTTAQCKSPTDLANAGYVIANDT